jgi:hypothetical protein
MGRDYPPVTCCAFIGLLRYLLRPPAVGFLLDMYLGVSQQDASKRDNGGQFQRLVLYELL